MKLIVIQEVERLLLRPNVANRARYYAITFLNQIVLSKSKQDVDAANTLIHLYFTLFTSMVKQLRAEAPQKNEKKRDKSKGKKDSIAPTAPVDALNSKLMAAILTGVNRAFPFSKLEDKVFDAHIDTLFTVSHLTAFNTSIQALTLIFQVQSSREALSDRFYRSLYETLFDQRLFDASKQAMYLNLLYRALKADLSIERVRAFVKRIVQSSSLAQIPLVCGCLFLLSELCNQNQGLWSMVSQPEEHEETDEKKYDGRKRDPLYANAGQSCLWELVPFTYHFHPTISLYAKSIINCEPIQVPEGATNYDPLLNHTLARFLDRFVFKAPKKVKSLHQGTSLMQPRSESSMLVSGGRRKRNVVYEDEEDGQEKAMDDLPVNQIDWQSKDSVPADEVSDLTLTVTHRCFFISISKTVKRIPNRLAMMNFCLIWNQMQRSWKKMKFGKQCKNPLALIQRCLVKMAKMMI
jgi:ribosome biogenesis protein MAK21